jgi:hypothetical protein
MFQVNTKSSMQKIICFLSSSYGLTLLFMLLILAVGAGHISRWDLLQQVSMADNYYNGGNFYPAINDPTPHGVSPYFPGVALLVVLLREIGFDFYVVESLILIACLVVLGFFYVQMKISEQILGKRVFWYQFAPFMIAFSLIVVKDWLFYAIEFKADTISLLSGFVGLYIAGFLGGKVSLMRLILGALLFSGAVVFKQQYVALVLGVLTFCFMCPTRERISFALFTAFFTSVIVFLLLKNPNIWFWNVTVLSDDGVLSVMQFLRANHYTFKSLVFSLVSCSLFLKLSKGEFIKVSKEYLRRVYQLPWVWGATFFIGACLLSGLKGGGNSGNTQLAILMLAPFIYAVFSNLPSIIFTTLAYAALLVSFPFAVKESFEYREATNLRSFVSHDVLNKPSIVLTSPNVYFASRHYPFNHDSVDYWALKESAYQKGELLAFSSLLTRVQADRLVLENRPANKAAINSDSRYKIIFENQLGFVAKLIQ